MAQVGQLGAVENGGVISETGVETEASETAVWQAVVVQSEIETVAAAATASSWKLAAAFLASSSNDEAELAAPAVVASAVSLAADLFAQDS